MNGGELSGPWNAFQIRAIGIVRSILIEKGRRWQEEVVPYRDSEMKEFGYILIASDRIETYIYEDQIDVIAECPLLRMEILDYKTCDDLFKSFSKNFHAILNKN